MNNTTTVPLAFAATHPYVQPDIVDSTERVIKNRDYVEWGDKNRYPEYLYQLYKAIPTLKTVINGSVDYVCGDGAVVAHYPQPEAMNQHGQTINELIHDLAFSHYLYGGYAIQVIRDNGGAIAELYSIDLRYLRTNKANEVFYYSEDWAKGASSVKTIVYPKFLPDGTGQASSILFVKNTPLQIYPEPIYSASVKACEIERGIDEYHLHALQNGFAGGTIINFGDAQPTDEQKDEIERNVNEKFAGPSNAGRIMLTWSDGTERGVTVNQLDVPDFADKYEVAEKRSRQQIFTAFRAHPNLFGIPTENLGFSAEEYEQTFKLYNRTQVKPVQRSIREALGKIFGNPDYLTIEPFSL